MAAVDHQTVQAFVAAGMAAGTTTDQGRALENLICYLFGLVPGIAITRRNQMNVFNTEEIDVALWNDVDPAATSFSSSARIGRAASAAGKSTGSTPNCAIAAWTSGSLSHPWESLVTPLI
jgi:hypothetical protein